MCIRDRQDRFDERNSDRITDFNPLEGDKIAISDTAFPNFETFAFSSIDSVSQLNDALKGEATFIYLKETGELYYNANPGEPGTVDGGLFATFNNRPALTADDFEILQLSSFL